MMLRTLEDTRALAERLAQRLPYGAVLLLTGPLGAGKTTLVQHLAAALGFRGRVTSPTYTLIHEYPTPEGLLVHIDAYRLPDPEDLFALGLEDYLGEARLIAVEWGRPEVFPESLEVRLEPTPAGRQVRLVPHGARYQGFAL